MTALEELKKAFPNMFRPLKWHHFDGPTEHGCGEWYAHATRGMYHIYDVREKFPNDRPFYAKELSDQFDTLEQAQDAVQNRHELDIVMCLDPDFRSTLESLQRENEESRELARAFEAEANQLREVSIANRHRAEAAEAGVKRLREELKFYGDAWCFTTNPKRAGLEWKPKEALLDDCGNRARTALASTGGEHHAE
ncbi:hypothetical protein G6L13_05390 [Agrobacterium tumefaciens]|uniref:hypothetical protein n=1 Tax=Agrobacterium tumefaciens TaxID=358 RepID=UPI00157219E7|nr:hypothetical protein [Agrobacterium tumefaciens]NTA79918.1 hypothetical protein [Agrobacterium tumefaciens]